MDVLAGAERAIPEFHPTVFPETHGEQRHRDCPEFLLARDYSVAEAPCQLIVIWNPKGQ
jgi:hypothetical protein